MSFSRSIGTCCFYQYSDLTIVIVIIVIIIIIVNSVILIVIPICVGIFHFVGLPKGISVNFSIHVCRNLETNLQYVYHIVYTIHVIIKKSVTSFSEKNNLVHSISARLSWPPPRSNELQPHWAATWLMGSRRQRWRSMLERILGAGWCPHLTDLLDEHGTLEWSKIISNERKDMDKPRRWTISRRSIFNPIHQVLHTSTTSFEHTRTDHLKCFGQSIHMENIHPNGFGCFSQRARPRGFSHDSQSGLLHWETLKYVPRSGILISPNQKKRQR